MQISPIRTPIKAPIRATFYTYNSSAKKQAASKETRKADVTGYSIYENKIPFTANYISTVKLQPERQLFESFAFKKGKVTLEEYKDIKNNHPDLIDIAKKYCKRDNIYNSLFQKPHNTATFVRDLKEEFDKKYGKGDYVIISVGTSPAFLTESMASLGTDIISLPVTGVRGISGYHSSNYERCKKDYPKVSVVADYLKNKLSSEEFKNKSKVLILDYVSWGKTINFIKNIVEDYCEIPAKKVKTCNLTEFTENLYGYSKSKKYAGDISRQKVEYIANTPHYNVRENDSGEDYLDNDDLKKQFDFEKEKQKYKKLENYSTPLARAYQLLVFDKLDKLGVLKETDSL